MRSMRPAMALAISLCLCLLPLGHVTGTPTQQMGTRHIAPSPTLASKLDGLFQRLGCAQVFSSAVLIAQQQTLLLRRAYGWANIDHRVPNTLQTIFRNGYGWFIGTRFHQRMLYHTGEINGFVAENDFYPDAGVTVIILCNLEHAALPIISADVEKLIFGRA